MVYLSESKRSFVIETFSKAKSGAAIEKLANFGIILITIMPFSINFGLDLFYFIIMIKSERKYSFQKNYLPKLEFEKEPMEPAESAEGPSQSEYKQLGTEPPVGPKKFFKVLDPTVIPNIGAIDCVLFDKTGTLTTGD